MALQLVPMPDLGSRNGSKVIIAAIPENRLQNGPLTYVVTAEDEREFVTWVAAFHPVKGEPSSKWPISYYWGHYFSKYDEPVDDARKRALSDMVHRTLG